MAFASDFFGQKVWFNSCSVLSYPFFTLTFIWLTLMITICFKFWNFIMSLFHRLGFTAELVFGSSTSVTRLNLFFGWFLHGSRFLKKPAGIACQAFKALSRGWILLELEKISFFLWFSNFSFRLTGFARLLRMFSRFYTHFQNLRTRSNGISQVPTINQEIIFDQCSSKWVLYPNFSCL